MINERLTCQEYIKGVLAGDRVILSRAITLIESLLPTDQELADKVISGILPFTGNSLRIGVTGVPGVGKSTFVEALGEMVLEKGMKLAVLTIDPSSQKSKGSILGDKTRMVSLSTNARAYIRPSPSGTVLGGVSSKTREAMLLCEAAGFEVIFIETVGVGQSEIAVKGMVDFFLLLMLAGAGDELQGIKKGIIEICDAMVIHKSDGDNVENAKKAKSEYTNALHLFPKRENGWIPRVLTCSSIEKTGLDEIWMMIQMFQETMKSNGFFEANRNEQMGNWMHDHIRFLLESRFYSHPMILARLSEELAQVKSGKVSPITKARELVAFYQRDVFKDDLLR